MAHMEHAPLLRTDAIEDSDYEAFHNFPFTKDQDFFAGVLAVCGGPEHLERTPAVADVIMHARIFYYKSKTGIAIPAIGYKDWLRGKGYSRVKPKEWDILELMCDKRDSNYAKKFGLPKYQPSIKDEAAMVAWLVTIYGDNIDIPLRPPYRSPNSRGQPQLQSQIESQPMAKGNSDTLQSQHEQQPTPSAPIWQTAAPKGELYVDRSKAPAEENGKGQSPDAPYPIRFAQIIEAVQTGQPVDGIQEIPDTVARNADTRPFGNMTAPKKPWEKAAKSNVEHAHEPGYVVIEKDFPKAEDDAGDAHD